MSPQVPSRRAATSLAVVALLAASVLTAVLTLSAGGAGAAVSTTSRMAGARSSGGHDPVLSRLLQRINALQGAHRGRKPITPTPAPSSSSSTSSAPSAAPTSSAPSSTPTSSAPTSSAPASSAPTSSTPSSTPTSTGTVDPSVAGLKLAYSDEFDGAAGSAPDQNMWKADIGGKWGSNELECYTNDRSNSALDGNGNLNITARYTPGHKCTDSTNNYTSARLKTQGLAASKYGKIRVRAKLPYASGVWPAIWLMGANIDSVGWPQCGEIDVMEAIGEDATTIHGTIIGPQANGSMWQTNQKPYSLSSPMNAGFHTYGLDWTPDSLTISVDGNDYVTLSKAQVTAAGNKWVFDQPFFLLLNVAVGGDWPGAPKNNDAFPQTMSVDYVRVYNQA